MVAVTVVMAAVLTAQMSGYLSTAPTKTPSVGLEQTYGQGNYSLTVVSMSGPAVYTAEVYVTVYAPNGTQIWSDKLSALVNGTEGKYFSNGGGSGPMNTLMTTGDNIVLTSPDCYGGTGKVTSGSNVRLIWKGTTIANVVLV
jgi:FlaG/FlaF family flagellin (archaellin)